MALLASVHITPMFAAGIEGIFVFLVIAAVSAVFNALRKKNGSTDDWSTGDAAPPNIPRRREGSQTYGRPETKQKQVDWEEELIRILQGSGAPVPPPRRPPVPPPIKKTPPPIAKPQPKSQPTMAVPEIFRQEKLYKGLCVNCGGHLEFRPRDMDAVTPCPHCNQLTVLRPYIETPVEALTERKKVSSFGQGAKVWQQASGIDQRTASEMQEKLKRPAGPGTIQGLRKRSNEIESVVGLVRDPRTARQAVIASLILSPPKALEG